ncbi:MAG: DUF2341 domain-containing protein [Desulfurococcaceae archaeon]
MPSSLLTHVIGATTMIALLVAVGYYVVISTNYVVAQNVRAVEQGIADSLANALMASLAARSNMTRLGLQLPVELYGGTSYNVYLGNGSVLSLAFPGLRSSPDFDPSAVYVVVSTPDGRIYAWSKVASPSVLGSQVYFAIGNWTQAFETVGFNAALGYSEGGIPWVCRALVAIQERSGTNLSNYAVRLQFNPSGLNCSYGQLTFSPTPNDVRFTDSDGHTPLPYYVESWTNLSAVVWVLVPSVSANSTKYIYMYWGNPQATSYSDPSKVFALYYNMSAYGGLSDVLADWGLRTGNVSSVNARSYVLGNVSGVAVNASLTKYRPAYINFYKTLNASPSGGQGMVVEAGGAPLSSYDQDWRLELFDLGSGFVPFNFAFVPAVVDAYTNFTNYTIVYGNFTVQQGDQGPYLYAFNTSWLWGYYVAVALRQNPAPQAPGGQSLGQEKYFTLYKVLVEPDGVLRGIIVANDVSDITKSSNNVFFALNGSETSLELWLGSIGNGNVKLSRLNRTSVALNEPTWFYLDVAYVQGPGNSIHVGQIYVYDENGNVVLSYEPSASGAVATLQPNYVGPIVLGTNNSTGSFNDLISGRYYPDNLPTSLAQVDPRYIYVINLAPNWTVTMYYNGESFSGTANESGVALIDVGTNPILGVLGPIEITISTSDGTTAFDVVLNQTISGGTILSFAPQLGDPAAATGAGIRASFNGPDRSFKGFWTWYLNNGTIKIWNSTGVGASANNYTLAGVGFFKGSAYYFLWSPSYSPLYNSSAPYGEPGQLAIVWGISSEFTTSSSGSDNVTAFYSWIRARPFVYPEPEVRIVGNSTESAAIPSQPSLSYSLKPFVVFSSKLLVDLAILVRDDGSLVVVAIFGGVRAR